MRKTSKNTQSVLLLIYTLQCLYSAFCCVYHSQGIIHSLLYRFDDVLFDLQEGYLFVYCIPIAVVGTVANAFLLYFNKREKKLLAVLSIALVANLFTPICTFAYMPISFGLCTKLLLWLAAIYFLFSAMYVISDFKNKTST